MKACRLLLLGLLLLLGSVVHAEGNCPPGYYPIGAPPGQGGPQGCAPIPGDNSNQQQAQPQLPSPPPEQWVTRWGAVATDFVHGSAGASVDESSKSDAEKAAIANCQSNGGSTCKVELAYDNECVAMTAGEKIHNVSSDATLDKAIQSSMKTCSAADTNCRVYYSACSLPVRIQ